MSTAASISQFMAILSGGTNPGLLRQNQSIQSTDKQSSIIDFNTLLNANSEEAPKTIDTLLANLDISQNGGEITQRDLVHFINRAKTEGETIDSSSIWQFIQQQANIDSGNQLVLNLSEKGIPDNVIQELKAVFGENDLITVIRDPKLSAQFDNALNALPENNEELSENLITVVSGILEQNKGDISNTLTFSVNEEKTLDEIVNILVNGSNQSDVIVDVQITDTQTRPQPLQLAFIHTNNEGASLQAANPVANSINPFTAAKGSPDVKGLENALNRVTAHGSERAAQAVQSNTNNVVGMVNNATQQNAPDFNLAEDFANAFISADGETLIADGDYAIPFEAALKTASQASNPLLSTTQASQSHQATHTVALTLTKMAQKSVDGEQSQRYRLQLDPPEMGRIDIEMDIIENTNKMKVVITAEKPESLGLLQRDMHALLKSMQDAGFDNISNSDIAFNLSQHGEDMAGGRGGNDRDHPPLHSQNDAVDGDMEIVESEMSVIIDPITGQQSVNMLV